MKTQSVLCLVFILAALVLPFSISYSQEVDVDAGTKLSDPTNVGAAAMSVPIVVPPGRNGIAPNIALSYSSGRGSGWVGVGWDLGMGAIQRATKRGLNYNGDDYVVSMNGAVSELVSRGGGYYAPKVEKDFNRYQKDANGYWVVTAKNGTRYFYGTSEDSRQTNPSDASQNFKWLLDRVEDVNGNYMTVFYYADQGEVYLDRIEYTGNSSTAAPLSPSYYVQFIREQRGDVPLLYTTGFPVRPALRLQTIEIHAATYPNRSLVRKYELEYIYSDISYRSLLTSVTQYGSDGTSLPPARYTWQNDQVGFSSTNVAATWWYYYARPGEEFCFPGDFNGDGRTDATCFSSTTNPDYQWGVYTHTSLYDPSTNSLSFPGRVGPKPDLFSVSRPFRAFPGDFNGDGKTDIMYVQSGLFRAGFPEIGEDGYLRFNFNAYDLTNSGWLTVDMGGILGSDVWFAADIDGDGKSDVVRVSRRTHRSTSVRPGALATAPLAPAHAPIPGGLSTALTSPLPQT